MDQVPAVRAGSRVNIWGERGIWPGITQFYFLMLFRGQSPALSEIHGLGGATKILTQGGRITVYTLGEERFQSRKGALVWCKGGNCRGGKNAKQAVFRRKRRKHVTDVYVSREGVH